MTIWYDLSGIFHWRGYFTGIQRVVYNLGKELADSDQPVKFFTYSGGGFSEVSFFDLEQRLEESSKKNLSDEDNYRRQITFAKIQHNGMVALKGGVRNTPLEKPLRKAYSGLRNAYRVVRSGSMRSRSYKHPFSNDDVVVIVDGNWQFQGYAQAIGKVKEDTSFKLLHFVNDIIAIRNPALANTDADKIIGKYFRKIFIYADRLITISESTRSDVVWFMDSIGLKRELAISVIRLGNNISNRKMSALQPQGIKEEPFILAVSTIEIRKNYLALYYTYKLALARKIDLPNLIIVGRKGWLAEEVYNLLTKDPDINQKVTILKHASDQELYWLYKNCLFTVFPSMYEGWGLPIAESLNQGKTCISSNTSSMPEVGGDFVKYVSPFAPQEFIDAITFFMNKNNRNKYEDKIKKEYKPWTWHQSYLDLKGIIEQISR
jgi:glycosyltransferase involved in cell wall biosynthesis